MESVNANLFGIDVYAFDCCVDHLVQTVIWIDLGSAYGHADVIFEALDEPGFPLGLDELHGLFGADFWFGLFFFFGDLLNYFLEKGVIFVNDNRLF